MKRSIELSVNGETYALEVDDRRTLVEAIRDDLNLLGTKTICGRGECGACTVLMDGLAVNSCLILAADAHGKTIETIEGVARGDQLHPIQENFMTKGAVQCGMCTAGMILTAKAFLQKNANPSEEEVKTAIAGNFCRCTGYIRIVDAILSSAPSVKEW
jgi:carbon-monoxide dehydrogenase small subunit